MCNLPLTGLAEYDADMEDAVEERSQPSRKKRHRNASRKHVEDSEVHCREREKQGRRVQTANAIVILLFLYDLLF